MQKDQNPSRDDILPMRRVSGKQLMFERSKLDLASRCLASEGSDELLGIILTLLGGPGAEEIHDAFMDSENARIRQPHEAAFHDGARFIVGQILYIKSICKKNN